MRVDEGMTVPSDDGRPRASSSRRRHPPVPWRAMGVDEWIDPTRSARV